MNCDRPPGLRPTHDIGGTAGPRWSPRLGNVQPPALAAEHPQQHNRSTAGGRFKTTEHYGGPRRPPRRGSAFLRQVRTSLGGLRHATPPRRHQPLRSEQLFDTPRNIWLVGGNIACTLHRHLPKNSPSSPSRDCVMWQPPKKMGLARLSGYCSSENSRAPNVLVLNHLECWRTQDAPAAGALCPQSE